MRALIVAAIVACAGASFAAPARIIVTAVASLHGANGAYFRSELHALNTASSPVTAQLTFRCWSGRPCAAATVPLTIAPRTNVVFNDIVVELAHVSESAGALEIEYDDAGGTLAVTSRLFNQTANGTFGQTVPALTEADGVTSAVFSFVPMATDFRHGLRSNAGGFNPGDAPATTTWVLHAHDGAELGRVTRLLAARESFQFGASVDAALGAAAADVPDAYLTVTASVPFLPYVSVVDNLSGDPTFLLPQRDAPAIAQELVVNCARYRFTPGSTTPIVLNTGVSYRLVFRSSDTTHSISAIPQLGIDGGTIAPDGDYVVMVTPPASLRGARFNFACTHVCGPGHGGMYGVIEVQ
jgi:hypothetical protein